MTRAAQRRHIRVSVEDGVGTIELHHPEKRNALGWDMQRSIIATLRDWEEDDDVACVLFIGGEDYFSSGWALDVLENITPRDQRRFADLALKTMLVVYDYPKPTVAAVAGPAFAYGMDFANLADITIAAGNARFGASHVRYGMNPYHYGTLRKTGAQRARRMLFTGEPVDATEALRTGLVDEVVPDGHLREAARDLARRVAAMGAELATVLKGVAARSAHMDHLAALTYEISVTHDLLQRPLPRPRLAAFAANRDTPGDLDG